MNESQEMVAPSHKRGTGRDVTDSEHDTTSSQNGGVDVLLDLSTVAERLAVCTRTIRRLVAAGDLPPPVKVGRASRWFLSDVQDYLSSLRDARASMAGWQTTRGAG